jgi:hypothetical protein
MKTNCFIYLCILLLAVAGCRDEDELIPREAFPDLLFEQYMLQNFDTDGDGLISLREAKAVREIDCSNMRITSLKGIQYFTSLETLNCSGNAINALDLTGNTALRSLNCNSCGLESIDLSKNTALEYLYCSENYNFKSLDLRSNTNLRELFCDDNQSLSSLNLSANTNLQVLSCNRNAMLLSLDLSANTNLRELSCIRVSWGNTVTITGLTGFRSLEKLVLSGVAIGAIDLGGNPLKEFNCVEIAVQSSISIDVSGCDKLETFRFTRINDGELDSEIQNINLAGCSALNTIEIQGIAFKSLDVSSCTPLRKLTYREGDVNISGNIELEEVYVRDILGNITSLRKLRTLYFRQIKNVETQDFSNQTVLEDLYCAVQDFPIDLSHCKALRTFHLNPFNAMKVVSIDLKDLPVLEQISSDRVGYKALLNIENCPVLKTILGYEYAALNVSGCASLEEIKCTFQAFNIDRCPNVTGLECDDSPVGTLRLDALTNLERLHCVKCSLTALDLRKNKKVRTLHCYNNPDLEYVELANAHKILYMDIAKDSTTKLRYWDDDE